MQGWFNIQTSNNVIHRVNRIKKKNRMIISIDVEKAFDKMQHPFITQNVIKLGTEGNFVNLIKNICEH